MPPFWEGIPSETFTAIEQICHVRDIELDGYHVRFQRALNEMNPTLESVDGYMLAKERNYASSHEAEVIAAFRRARAETVQLLSSLTPVQFGRTARFEGYGAVTVLSLAHYRAATINSIGWVAVATWKDRGLHVKSSASDHSE